MNKNDVHKFRAFNRFYTRVTGLLDRYLLDSNYTLSEVRVMYEIYHHKKITSKEICNLLGMDKGYLSRILLKFSKSGLLFRKTARNDGRAQEISLTEKGEKAFLVVNRATENQIAELLSGLTKQETQELTAHMDGIQRILSRISN